MFAANFGNSDAQVKYGDMYINGDGVKVNYEKAMDMYQKAAAQNNPSAFCRLGIMYLVGYGVARNIDKSKQFFHKSCNLGDVDGCQGYEKVDEYRFLEDLEKIIPIPSFKSPE